MYEKGKCSFERGIIAVHFGGKYASLPLPISEQSCGHVQVSVLQMAPLLNRLTTALENDRIAAISFEQF